MTQILLPKLERVMQMQGCIPNEVNSIEYRRQQGHWLKDHADDRQKYKEPIANLSLAGDCYMTYHNEKQSEETSFAEFIRKPWPTVGRERFPATFGSPVEIWNQKNRAYLNLNQHCKAVNFRYEDLLRDLLRLLSRSRDERKRTLIHIVI